MPFAEPALLRMMLLKLTSPNYLALSSLWSRAYPLLSMKRKCELTGFAPVLESPLWTFSL